MEKGVIKVLDFDMVVRAFEPKWHYSIHFQTNTLQKSMKSSTNWLNSTTTILLQEWFWY